MSSREGRTEKPAPAVITVTRRPARFLIRAHCGDRDAMEHVLRTIQISLHRYVQRLVGPTATDHVLQTTLISVAEHLKWLSELDYSDVGRIGLPRGRIDSFNRPATGPLYSLE